MRIVGLAVLTLPAGCAPSGSCGTMPQRGCPCIADAIHCHAELVCESGAWRAADPGECGALDTGTPMDAGLDAGSALDCDGGAIAHGCPCDGTPLTVCTPEIDFVCSNGTWLGHAGLCAMLDGGMPCTDEHRFTCGGGHGTVCCYGQLQEFFDGPCGAPAGLDGGDVACGASPRAGCPCEADAEASACDGEVRLACVAGTWRATDYACGILCSSGA